MGIRTPDLLHAMRSRSVCLGLAESDGEGPTCKNGLRKSGICVPDRTTLAHQTVSPASLARHLRLISAGSSSVANGRVIRPGVPAVSVVRVTYRPRLREHTTIFGTGCSSTRQ